MTHRHCLLICWLLAAGCTPKPNYLLVAPGPEGVQIELRSTVGLFQRREVPLPLSDCVFLHVADDGLGAPPRETWRVMSLSPDRAALAIRYGRIPAGFTQVTPFGEPAPALEPGALYVVECSGDDIGVTEFRMPEPSPRSVPE